MQCPRCNTPSMIELDREGVTIDRCDRCRGIWLDRGELEKLISRDAERWPPADEHHQDALDRNADRRDRDRDHDDDDGRRGRRRSWWSLFD